MGYLIFSLTGLILPIAIGLLVDAIPVLAKHLVCHSAARLAPADRADYRDDWLANLDASSETRAGKFYWALQCYKASLILRPPLLLTCWRVRLRYRRLVLEGSAQFTWWVLRRQVERLKDGQSSKAGPLLGAVHMVAASMQARLNDYVNAWAKTAFLSKAYTSEEQVRFEVQRDLSEFGERLVALAALSRDIRDRMEKLLREYKRADL